MPPFSATPRRNSTGATPRGEIAASYTFHVNRGMSRVLTNGLSRRQAACQLGPSFRKRYELQPYGVSNHEAVP